MSNKLMIRYPLLFLILLLLASCQKEQFGVLDGAGDSSQNYSEGLISLTTERKGGRLKLSINALEKDRTGVWIDLNGDGQRANTEEVKLFDTYQEYQLAPGVEEVNIYGGITYFAAAGNDITNISIEKNPSLAVLHLPINKLQTIDLSKNRSLKAVDLANNEISHIDLSGNRELESIVLHQNNLTELNVELNRALQLLDCSNNKLSAIDVAQNRDLEELFLYNNQLTDLNVAQNSRLNKLWLFGNTGIDKEQYLELISSLNKTSSGSLWLSNDEVGDNLKSQALLRGWTLE